MLFLDQRLKGSCIEPRRSETRCSEWEGGEGEDGSLVAHRSHPRGRLEEEREVERRRQGIPDAGVHGSK